MKQLSKGIPPRSGYVTGRSSTQKNTARLRRFLSLLAVILLSAGLCATAVKPAAAAATFTVGQWGTWHGGVTYWGPMGVNGRNTICIDPVMEAPENLDDATAQKICGNGNDNTAQLAWLLGRYVNTGDKATGVSLSQFVRYQYDPDIPAPFYPDRYSQMAAKAVADAGPKTGMVSIDADAMKLTYGLVMAGQSDPASAHFIDGYQATITLTSPNVTFADGSTTQTVTTQGQAASLDLKGRHSLIAGENVSASISIAGVPDSCFLLHPGNGAQRVLTPLYITVTGQGQGAPTQTHWTPQITTDIADTVVKPGTTTVSDAITADAINGTGWPATSWQDSEQTKPRDFVPFVADGHIVKATSPQSASKDLPAGASVVPGDPALATLKGPGITTTSNVRLPSDPGSGYYSLRWCLDPAFQGDNAKFLPPGGATCDDYFAANERFTVPMRIAVASAMPSKYSAKGMAPDDSLTLSLPDKADQWMAGADGKPAVVHVEGTYYTGGKDSFVISDAVPAHAKVLGTATVNVTLPTSGNAPVIVKAPAGFTVPTSQYGVWVWRIDTNNQPDATKDLIASSVADKFGQSGETHVTQMDLAVKSQVAKTDLPEPTGDGTAQVCDAVWVEQKDADDAWLDLWGTNNPVPVTVDGGVYHAAVPGAQTLDPGSTPEAQKYSLTFTAAGQAHAQTVCHSVKYDEYGAYGFAYQINLDHQPDGTKDYLSQGTQTPLWLPVETSMVKRTPVIHSSASKFDTSGSAAGNQGAGDVTYLQDQLWQTDWPDGTDNSDMAGAVNHGQWPGYGPWGADGKTVTMQLWRIDGQVTPEACSADNPKAKLIATNDAQPALNTWAGAQIVSGSAFKSDGPGTYTFVVSWPGDARTEPYRSVCGEPSETINLTPQMPSTITQLITDKGTGNGTVVSAQAVDKPATLVAGQQVADMLHVWNPDDKKPLASMAGWQASWDAYFAPADQQGHPADVSVLPSGQKVVDPAVCSDSTHVWASPKPTDVAKPGDYLSESFTAPNKPGTLFMVETITDTSKAGNPVVERGTCGAVAETGVIQTPQTPSVPKIGTQAPADATVGTQIRDTASLTGPYPAGTVVEFWVQHTGWADPDKTGNGAACVKPDPNDMTGAQKVASLTLDHAIAAGQSETVQSPQFTSGQAGCTNIKEIAYAPSDKTDSDKAPQVLAQGWFGQTSEVTRWHPAPAGVGVHTGGASAGDVAGLIVGGGLLASGVAVTATVVVKKRRVRVNG